MDNHRNRPRLGDDPRILEWLTLILQFVLLGAVIAYGQVMSERQGLLQDMYETNNQILREIQQDHTQGAANE